MSDGWYALKGGERIGPLTQVELKKELATNFGGEESLVWRSGFAGWTKAAEIAELHQGYEPVRPVEPRLDMLAFSEGSIAQFKLPRERTGTVGKILRFLFSALIAYGVYLAMTPLFWQQVRKDTDTLYNQVASDAVKRYEIVSRSGNPIDICLHAGIAAASFVQAKDEVNYTRWREVERRDCAKAGVPR